MLSKNCVQRYSIGQRSWGTSRSQIFIISIIILFKQILYTSTGPELSQGSFLFISEQFRNRCVGFLDFYRVSCAFIWKQQSEVTMKKTKGIFSGISMKHNSSKHYVENALTAVLAAVILLWSDPWKLSGYRLSLETRPARPSDRHRGGYRYRHTGCSAQCKLTTT